MKSLLLLVLLGLVAVAGVRVFPRERSTIPVVETALPRDSTISSPASLPTPTLSAGESRREIALTARRWTYDPFRITAKQGERLRVTLATADAPHSFMLPLTPGGEMAHVTAAPGKPAPADFDVVQPPGTYYFWCETPCGAGHSEMHGEFVVEGCPECA